MTGQTEGKIEEEGKKIAAAVVEQLENEDELVSEEDVNDEEARTEIEKQAASEDVFDAGEKKVELGQPVKYEIKKNGSFLTTVFPPFSWDMLKKQFGAGAYVIRCKTVPHNKVVKQQTQSVSDEQSISVHEPEAETPASVITSTMSAKDVISAAKEIAELSKPKGESSDASMFTALTQLMQNNNNSASESGKETTKLFMEMMKNTQDTSKTIQDSTTKLIDKMAERAEKANSEMQVRMEKQATDIQTQIEKSNTRFEKLIEKMSEVKKPDDAMTMVQLFDMKEKAETKGYNRSREISELIEEKTNHRVEQIQELKGSGGDGSSDSSIVGKLIESTIPLLQRAHQSMPAPAAAPLPAPTRRSVSPEQRPTNSPTRVNPSKTPPNRAQAPASVSEKSEGAIQSGRTDNGRGSVAYTSNGLATFKFDETKKAIEPDEIIPEPAAPTSEQVKEYLVQNVEPIITNAFIAGKNNEAIALEILEFLNKEQCPVEYFFEMMPKEAIMEVTGKYGIKKEDSLPYVEDIYDNIRRCAGTKLGGNKPTDGIR